MLEKSFTPSAHEARLYDEWEAAGLFKADPQRGGTPFSIMFPPPNVTGSLHFGHALDFVLQDVLIRWKRLEGYNVLWQPGTDHAGIATQMVVERLLDQEGVDRKKLGREKFLERVWAWKERSGGQIIQQLRKLGASADWERERFTMDQGLSEAVREVFVTLYRQGLIYRAKRLVNWDPSFRSAISDLEVENKETRGSMWYLRYPVEDGGSIVVGTTRPETILGDTAVAVHPDDGRYTALIGKYVLLPLTGRRIPIVSDTYSDPEKGTGAVKITPAHDFNDFDVGKRHDLSMPSVLDEGGAIFLDDIADELQDLPGLASVAFVHTLKGLDRTEARKRIVAELEALGLLVSVEPHILQVPHAQRGNAIIEPRLTEQWYCDAGALAKPAIAAVEANRVRFQPQQWENTFYAWMRDIQPWCISRQLWWGHRIPVWYGPDGSEFVARDEAAAYSAARERLGADVVLRQDEDVLDTWFSSALWPFSTLGWPRKTEELQFYYPTSVLVTGFDIIFFWVARMMMMGLHFMNEVPFTTVFIHGLVRDERGQKMSKSKGNGLDPLDLIDEFGADATRLSICALTGPGRDIKFGRKRVEEYRAFVTKIWNAARFCELQGVKPDPHFDPSSVQTALSRWILGEARQAIGLARQALDNHRFDEFVSVCYRFIWGRFCDWFLELAKPELASDDGVNQAETRAVTAYVLGAILRLMHPVIPFVTETLWQAFAYGGRLAESTWPAIPEVPGVDHASEEIDWVIRFVSEVRVIRSEMNVASSLAVTVLMKDAAPETLERARIWSAVLRRLAKIEAITVCEDEIPQHAASSVLNEATLILPLQGLINIDEERRRLAKEVTRLEREIEKVERKLSSEDFLSRAKPEIIEENRARLVSFTHSHDRLRQAFCRLESA